jgi:hypothetical protein
MIGNLRAAGLAVVVAVAISAIGVGNAYAAEEDHLEVEEYPALMDLSGSGSFQLPGLPTLTCAEFSGHGSVEEKESSEVTGTETGYGGCHLVSLGITFPITIDMEGCHLTITITPENGHTTCPEPNNGLTVTLFKAGSTGHSEADLRCTMHVPNQTNEGTYTYENTTVEGSMAVEAALEGSGVTVEITASTLCGAARTVTAEWNTNALLTATNEASESIDVTVEETPR